MPSQQRRSFSSAVTDDEKRALVNEVQRRNRDEGRPIEALARELGLPCGAYYRWLKLLAAKQAAPKSAPSSRSRPSPGKHYDPEIRAALVAEISGRLLQGEEIEAACRAVGLSRTTYRRWTQPPAPTSSFRPVALAPEAPSLALALLVPAASPGTVAAARPPEPVPDETLTLSAPGGYRLEGLTVEAAARLLRALAC